MLMITCVKVCALYKNFSTFLYLGLNAHGYLLEKFSIEVCLNYCLLNDKKTAQIVWSQDLVHEEPFGYRVAHHGYLLTSCPGHFKLK